MDSKDIELASNSPYVRALTLQVIRAIRRKKTPMVREIVHADLVPKFSTRVIERQLREKIIVPKNPIFVPKIIPPKRETLLIPSILNMKTPQNVSKMMAPIQDYGKINNLLNDPSVSSIECLGPGKKIMVIRTGQKQTTNIDLSAIEIKGILDRIADKAHLPLSEGVFRAEVDNFSINAVISEIIGTKFLIKKNTPYSLLER